MPTTTPTPQLYPTKNDLPGPRAERLYPTLTPAQLARITVHGRARHVERGEVLVQAGEQTARLFVVVAGRLDVFRPSVTEEVLLSLTPGMFTGEATMLSGRPGLAQIRAGADGEVIEVARDDLLALIQTDGELSAIFMRAFILRRGGRVPRPGSHVVVRVAAAVYGASEGLDVLVVEATATGGQAGASSRIENYLGFPTGIPGIDLAARATNQAQKFGAQLMIGTGARRLVCDRAPYALEIGDGRRVPARAVIIATGAEYRRLTIDGLPRFEGAGVYYAATFMEAQLCAGEEVVVVGGGNSAGQAAVFLAETARRVHMVIRSAGLADTMSRYLIRRIEDHPAIVRHVHTEIVSLEGNGHLERLGWRDGETGQVETHAIRHVFTMTGAVPSTHWLDKCLALDAKGFIKTGPDLLPEDLATARWPLTRAPHLLETSLPGVFAIGDVRAGSLKRVASAVGEGSIAIDPSPTADATRFKLPARTSPIANTPGRLVSRRWGARVSGQRAVARSSGNRSGPVLMNPLASRARHLSSQWVLGTAPVMVKTCRIACVSTCPVSPSRQPSRSR